jgi:hypothetical protein
MKNKPGFSLQFLFTLFIAVVSTVMLFCSGTIESQDGWLYLSVSKNIYYRHVIEAAPDEYPIQNVHINSYKDASGRWRSPGALGYSIAMVPAVALSDLTHRSLGTSPSNHFPLEHDWTLHLFASFTNATFAGLLVVIIVLYLFDLTGNKKVSIIIGILSLFATNLLPLSKFSFAHVMFTSLLLMSFYCLRRFVITKRKKYAFFFLTAYVCVYFSYNVSYYIPILPLILYYFLLIPKQSRFPRLVILTALSLVAIVIKREIMSLLFSYRNIYPKILLEGVWGFLFSSGKSIFLYSPPLILLFIFWNKIPKKYLPEICSFCLLALLYLYLLGSPWISGSDGRMAGIWYGGMVWGPRYISTLIPFGMILVGIIAIKLSKKALLFVFVPFILFGFWIQLVGSSLPYLLQYQNTPPYDIAIGDQSFSVYDYTSFLPRFSPVYVMSREFLVKIKKFKASVDHGLYDVRLYDGFEVPLFTGLGPYRGFRSEGHIFATHTAKQPLQKLFIRFYNAPDVPEATASASISLHLNGASISGTLVPGNGHAQIETTLDSRLLKTGRNSLDLSASYLATASAQQVVYITQMVINDQNINLESLDYPEVSTGGKEISPVPYQYYGNRMDDKWKLWYLRARISERTFDFWWIKNLYYWDRPQRMIWILFAITVTVSLCGWTRLIVIWRKTKGTT